MWESGFSGFFLRRGSAIRTIFTAHAFWKIPYIAVACSIDQSHAMKQLDAMP